MTQNVVKLHSIIAIKIIDLNIESISLLGLEISKLESVLHQAAELSIEGHQTYAKSSKPRGKGKWNSEIAKASKHSKYIHKQIRKNRTCSKELKEDQKAAKKKLRRLQRQQAHKDRESLYREIMAAKKEDQQLFYKLVNKQRSNQQHTTNRLIVEGNELTTHEDILDGWKVHFQKLATPQDKDQDIDRNFEDLVIMNDLLIQQLCKDINEPITPVTHEEIQDAIIHLKKNKAPDAYGITAEHIQLAQEVPLLTYLVNKTIESGSLPHHRKEGILTPVLKKGKDQKIPTNYRGITVTTVFSKILEHSLQTRLDMLLEPTQSKLQRGFTAKTSPLNAAFLVSEAIAENKDLNNSMELITLDAEKAFDRVWHERLFQKLYNDGIQGNLWLLLRDLQANGSTKVKWDCNLSNQFQTKQGIRQGAKLSTTLYKRYNNPLLKQIEKQKLGTNIGATNVGAPTVADDISMLPSNPVDAQIMLHTVYNNAKQDKVRFNASKSDIIIYNNPNSEKTVWEIGKDKIESSRNTTHLGLVREYNNKFDIQPKMQVARRTMYSLMGAGLHGRRGLNPLTSYKIWECFGLPRATYGLESIKLTKKDIDSLERYQRALLRQLQSLPDRCASIPVYTLLGAKPIEIAIDIKALSSFTNMLRQRESIQFQNISRQLEVKGEKSSSLTINIRKILQKYDLPDAYDLIQNTPTKEKWKKNENPLDEPHPIYKDIGSDPHDVEKASIKARLLTGTYTLQTDKHKFNQYEVDKTCELCNQEPEDRKHFIIQCTVLAEVRKKYIPALLELVPKIETKSEDLLQLILDSTHENLSPFKICKKKLQEIEKVTRNLLYELHTQRTRVLARRK